MTDQQWEFCVLYLYSAREGMGKWYCRLEVRYLDQVGALQTLSQSIDQGGTAWAHNPWSGAMAQLGGFGWELVSVQHGDSSARNEDGLLRSNCFAYFKRPVKAGRRADEPKLTLE